MNPKYITLVIALLHFAFSFMPSQAEELPKTQLFTPFLQLQHEKWIDVMAIAPDGKWLASATVAWKDNKATATVHLWSLQNGQLKKLWEVGAAPVKALAFSHDGKILAVGCKSLITLWNSDGQQQKTLSGHPEDVDSLAFSPDGRTLASGSLRRGEPGTHQVPGDLFLWDLKTGVKREVLTEGPGGARIIAFSPDSTQIVMEQSQFTVGVWDVATLRLKKTITDETLHGVITALAFSPDAKTIAVGSLGHGLKLWDAQSGQLQATLLKIKDDWHGTGPSGGVNGIVFCPDGETMISAGDNQEGPGGESELLIWNWPKREIKYSLLKSPSSGISRFAASPDGKFFATVESLSPIIKVWHMP